MLGGGEGGQGGGAGGAGGAEARLPNVAILQLVTPAGDTGGIKCANWQGKCEVGANV